MVISKNLMMALARSINALVPNTRARPVKGLSLLNLGAIMPIEKTSPPLSTVDKTATTINNVITGRINT